MEERKIDFKKTIMENYGRDGEFWVTLIPLPEIAEKSFASSKDTIVNNIIKFSDSEEEENGEESINFNAKFEAIENKVMKNARKREKRIKKIKKINFLSKRLPNLARKINAYFLSEKKNVVLQVDILSHLPKNLHNENDLDQIINKTEGWLTKH